MNIGAKILNIQDILNELVRIKSEIESDQCNDAQKFVLTKLSQILLAQVEHLQSSESNNAQTDELSFSRNAEIMTFLLNIVSLCTLNPSMTHRNSAEIADSQSQEQTQKQYTMDDKISHQRPTKFTMSTKQIDSEQQHTTDGSTESTTPQQQKLVVSTKFTESSKQIDTEQTHKTASLTKYSDQQTKTTGLIKSIPQKQQPPKISANTGQQQQQQHPNKSLRTPFALDGTIDKDKVSTKENETTTQKQKLYKILSKSEYNIQQPEDEGVCTIWSSCMLQNGNIVLADFDNNKLKLIDNHKYHVISSLKLDNAPMSVCEVNEGEIAVCMFISRKIVFVSVCDDKLTSVRSLSMDHNCNCITVMGDKMYVCDNKTVYIYTLSGERLNTICKEKSGLFTLTTSNIFSIIMEITASEDGRMLHVADFEKGVITVSTDGKVVWRYTGTELDKAWGVCTDGGQSVFVSGIGSNNVVQLSEDGKCLGEVASREDGLDFPRTVCYNKNNNTLVIGQEETNNILVLRLTH